jgi:hypothetical protein
MFVLQMNYKSRLHMKTKGTVAQRGGITGVLIEATIAKVEGVEFRP